jgi:hypothetical protein
MYPAYGGWANGLREAVAKVLFFGGGLWAVYAGFSGQIPARLHP